jgi:hypothetical protein
MGCMTQSNSEKVVHRNEVRVQPVPYRHPETVESDRILCICGNFRESVTKIVVAKPLASHDFRHKLLVKNGLSICHWTSACSASSALTTGIRQAHNRL